MIFVHRRIERKLGLLAEGLLPPDETAEVRRHVERCAPCADTLVAIERTLTALRESATHIPEPPLSTSALVARIESRIEGGVPRRTLVPWPLRTGAFAAAAVACLALLVILPPAHRPQGFEVTTTVLPDETLLRMERVVAREGIARYLSEAGDIFVATTATALGCDEESPSTVDLANAPDSSRELLMRRAGLVASGAPPFAEPILDDVEYALRDVAELPSCARRADIARIREEIERRQILLRLRLAVRELEG